MTETIRDTPIVTRTYCPGCEPDAEDAEQLRATGQLLEVRWCDPHTPDRAGAEDATVALDSYPAGSGEAGGESNRAWCALLHPRRRRR
jgi:hypothetical protein